jgi:hypothetical protein
MPPNIPTAAVTRDATLSADAVDPRCILLLTFSAFEQDLVYV